MTSFALITEGITDQVVLEYILDGLSSGDATTTALRPLRDATDASRVADNEFSGWEKVFDFLKSEDIIDAIDTNDFVIIQIDTDMGDHPHFGLSLREKTIITIVEECIGKLKSSLHPEFPPSELERLLFAIPVLSTECWILSLHHFINNNKGYHHNNDTITNCEDDLTQFLERQNSSFEKKCEVFRVLCKDFRKQKNIQAVAQRTPCLQHFVNQVNAACPSF